jgi:hypothetical protein
MKRILTIAALAALLTISVSAQTYKGMIGEVVPIYVELKYKFVNRFEGWAWIAPSSTPYRVTATYKNGYLYFDGLKYQAKMTSRSIIGPYVDLWRS